MCLYKVEFQITFSLFIQVAIEDMFKITNIEGDGDISGRWW